MTEPTLPGGAQPPLSLAFFDPDQGISGQARQGLTLLFQGDHAEALAGAEELERAGEGYSVVLADRLELDFEPVAEAVELGVARVRLCRVRGRAEGKDLDCLGTAAETSEPPDWAGLEAVRAVCALFSPDRAVVAAASRPLGAGGHGEEILRAAMIEGGEASVAEEARLSTVYDADGRQRGATLELVLPAEDFPRRAFGQVLAGTTLDLEGLTVHAAAFSFRMEGRDGLGAYDLTARAPRPAAA
jgi:hypothetical protein